ncbi:MAG TPA: glycoside hydrolase family 2 protein [Anaerolineae bacterium]|nr:glycoside hydrolase family 2 protein [Anaerolineae bacterium]HQH39454.1 glycoside hydrolase family 2 protein [Anaerolineae bacterium]
MYIQPLTGEWQFRKNGAETWLPAHVPGGVHTDLMALNLIPDPFVADNEKRVLWVAENDWVYRRAFTADAALLAEQRVFLVCDGLDTLAEVTLNGQRLGETDNMFRQYTWDVKSLLHEGENELVILFRSPVQYITARQAERPLRGVSQAIPGGPYLRKAPCQFGWDWGPQLPPIGVWKDIRLEGRSHARLADVHVRQQHNDGAVMVAATVTLERWDPLPFKALLRVTAPDGTVQHAQAVMTGDTQTLTVQIDSPQLWWPNGYGAQPLYVVEIFLLADDAVCDAARYKMGLRTLELRREPDAWGESFTFVVNGVPIFAKGANWIPADSFPTRITDAFLEQLIRDAALTHQNMLRVWGGGFYEEERFYDLCDKYGILVWQDCIYSCSIYPMWDDAFIENTRVETVQNVRRLRHRASLALWCGNNEMEAGWVAWGWNHPENADLKADYDRFFHHLLPEWIAAEDSDRPYWPSSPSTGIPFQPPHGQERGDAHYWDVWHGGQPFSAYRGQYPRFMSEFGFQALPPLATIQTYADEADWNMTSYIMEHHQRHAGGNGKIIAHMTDHYRMPKDFPSLVYLSQLLQAEGIRFGVEHWRRHMGRVSGTLYWQLNDCWPVASWSSLDSLGRWKLLHYAARRFYAPLLLSVEDTGTLMGIHVTSDLPTPWEGIVCWSLQTVGGEELASGSEPVTAAPLASTHVRTLNFGDRVSDENCRDVIFFCELRQGATSIAQRVATFVPDKHLSLVDPALSATVSQEQDALVIDVTAKSLARFVELGLFGTDVVFSDNAFDVPAGHTVRVTCPLPPGWSVEDARIALWMRSLYDSYV